MSASSSRTRTGSRLRALLANVLELVQVRFELLVIEAREETMRVLNMVLFGVVAVYLFSLSLVFLSLLVVAHWWDTPYRMWAVFGVAMFFAVLGGVALLLAYGRFKRGSYLFSASREEIERDQERLRDA